MSGGSRPRFISVSKSLEYLKLALTKDPQNHLARLTLGWTYKEAGKPNEARSELRRAVQGFWRTEKTQKFIFDSSVTDEAIRYLLPLLNKRQDSAEIARLTVIQKSIAAMPRTVNRDLVREAIQGGTVTVSLEGAELVFKY